MVRAVARVVRRRSPCCSDNPASQRPAFGGVTTDHYASDRTRSTEWTGAACRAVPEPLETPGIRKPPTESVRRADPASPDQAAELLTSAAGASEPVDFATGAAVLYSGGTTRRDGSSTRGPGMAAEGRPARSSVVGREPSLPDRSPPASLASRPDWRCPFPSQANRHDHLGGAFQTQGREREQRRRRRERTDDANGNQRAR
jgi:hypothetical protein